MILLKDFGGAILVVLALIIPPGIAMFILGCIEFRISEGFTYNNIVFRDADTFTHDCWMCFIPLINIIISCVLALDILCRYTKIICEWLGSKIPLRIPSLTAERFEKIVLYKRKRSGV